MTCNRRCQFGAGVGLTWFFDPTSMLALGPVHIRGFRGRLRLGLIKQKHFARVHCSEANPHE